MVASEGWARAAALVLREQGARRARVLERNEGAVDAARAMDW
jgi:hypothetical protein